MEEREEDFTGEEPIEEEVEEVVEVENPDEAIPLSKLKPGELEDDLDEDEEEDGLDIEEPYDDENPI